MQLLPFLPSDSNSAARPPSLAGTALVPGSAGILAANTATPDPGAAGVAAGFDAIFAAMTPATEAPIAVAEQPAGATPALPENAAAPAASPVDGTSPAPAADRPVALVPAPWRPGRDAPADENAVDAEGATAPAEAGARAGLPTANTPAAASPAADISTTAVSPAPVAPTASPEVCASAPSENSTPMRSPAPTGNSSGNGVKPAAHPHASGRRQRTAASMTEAAAGERAEVSAVAADATTIATKPARRAAEDFSAEPTAPAVDSGEPHRRDEPALSAVADVSVLAPLVVPLGPTEASEDEEVPGVVDEESDAKREDPFAATEKDDESMPGQSGDETAALDLAAAAGGRADFRRAERSVNAPPLARPFARAESFGASAVEAETATSFALPSQAEARPIAPEETDGARASFAARGSFAFTGAELPAAEPVEESSSFALRTQPAATAETLARAVGPAGSAVDFPIDPLGQPRAVAQTFPPSSRAASWTAGADIPADAPVAEEGAADSTAVFSELRPLPLAATDSSAQPASAPNLLVRGGTARVAFEPVASAAARDASPAARVDGDEGAQTQSLFTPQSAGDAGADAPVVTTPPPARAHTANSAARFAPEAPRAAAPISSRGKSFLSSAEKQLTERPKTLGIDTAKSATAMPSAPTLELPRDAAPLREVASELAPAGTGSESVSFSALPAGAAAVHATLAAEVRDVSAPAETFAVSSAHRAVEVVLTAVDHVASRERHAVDLQFSVGGEDLSVRVELRADAVHATFRTDSTELRAALAHEWQGLSGDNDRGHARVTPVFTSAGSSAFAGGDAAAQQRDSRSRQPADEAAARSGAARGRRSAIGAVSGAGVALSAVSTARAMPRTSRHLHTLA
jgi:hypothetical protein